MIQEIIEGVASFLKELYPKWNVYDHNPQQGLEPDCFIVTEVNGTFKRTMSSPRLGITGTDKMMFSITVIPKSTERKVLRDVTREIRIRLNFIDLEDGPIRVYAINSNYNDMDNISTVLFRVAVRQYIKGDPLPRMQTLSMEEKTRVNG